MSDPRGGPLQGITVLEVAFNLPGPYAGLLLAAQGATVIKVESPKGDPARNIQPFFSQLNRGKQSVVVDLKGPDGPEAFRRLADGADVLIDGFRPGVLERLGCGPRDCQGRNPRLVWLSLTAYGQRGPRRDDPGHDLNAQAVVGACHLNRDARGRPDGMALPVADLSAGLAAAQLITGALLQRERTGEGTVHDLAMTDALAGWVQLWGEGIDLASPARRRLGPLPSRALGGVIRRLDRERLHALPHYGVYRCAGGGWLAVGIVDEDKFWRALCRELGLGPAGRLPFPARLLLGPALRRLVGRRLRSRSVDHWLDVLTAAGIPVTEVATPARATRDPQAVARGQVDGDGLFVPPGGTCALGRAPRLGEHSDRVLGGSTR